MGDAEAPLRILLTVHHEVGPSGDAGSTVALADELERRGHAVEVVGMGVLQTYRRSTVDAVRFPHVVGRLLRRRLDEGDCDVIDASSGDLAYVGERRVRAASTAVFTHSQGLEHLAVERRLRAARDGELRLRRRYRAYHAGLRLWEVERSFRAADGALVLNDEELEFARDELHVAPERLWVTAPVLRPLAIPPLERTRDVLVLGPRTWRAGGDVAVAVLTDLLGKDPTITASWFGLGDPDAVCAALGSDVGARVELGGSYDDARLAQLFASHKVLLFPARLQGSGTTLLDALAAGLTAVGADVPDTRGLLTGGAGLLVDDGDAPGFAAAISRLLADDELRAMCQRNATKVLEAHAPGRVVDELERAYRTVLSVKRPSN
jgi:glycosyltransferase involved in cell wall biosynthesis